ncbi:MAG: hypothetical protein AAB368_13300, partial [bacterium]
MPREPERDEDSIDITRLFTDPLLRAYRSWRRPRSVQPVVLIGRNPAEDTALPGNYIDSTGRLLVNTGTA